MTNLDGLNKSELQDLLKNLNLYKNLVTKVGKRGKKIFSNLIEGKNEYKVEYYSALGEDDVAEEAIKVYKKAFGLDVSKEEITFEKSDKVRGGMKLYMNDSMIDMSFLKFYNLLK